MLLLLRLRQVALHLWVPSYSPLWLCSCHKRIRLTGSSKLGIGNLWPRLHSSTAGIDSSSPLGVKAMLEKTDGWKLMLLASCWWERPVSTTFLSHHLQQCAMFCKYMILHLRLFFFFQWRCREKQHMLLHALSVWTVISECFIFIFARGIKRRAPWSALSLWLDMEQSGNGFRCMRSLNKMLVFNKSMLHWPVTRLVSALDQPTNSFFLFWYFEFEGGKITFFSRHGWNKNIDDSAQCSQVQPAGPGECLHRGNNGSLHSDTGLQHNKMNLK